MIDHYTLLIYYYSYY